MRDATPTRPSTSPTPSAPPPGHGFERSRALQSAAHALIPGGAHTYAKGDDQYPLLAPGFIARGSGCHVWDVDGNEYIEYGMGLRAVTLGHAYPSVVKAAHQAMLQGTNFTRPSPLEVECAEALLGMIPGAEMVKFSKNGSDATTAAVKLARAYTGRDLVGICGDQPFFSTDDWFIGTTAMSAGIPAAIKALTVGFKFNDLESVRALFAAHPSRIACLVLEAATSIEPADGFLSGLKAICHEHGALLVFDEMITGFRWHNAGAQGLYGVTPDLSTFGKGLANGFSLSALVGRRDVMRLGGLDHDRERVFLLSTTHGAETHALAAAVETMRIYQREDVIETLYRRGERLRRGVREATTAHGVAASVDVLGRPCNLVFVTRDPDGRPSQVYRALFMQELIRRGVLGPSFVVSYSHTEEDIDRTIDAVDGALAVYARALVDGPERYLEGRPLKPVMRARN
ncbi:MAG TPA: glutamate-1-semialdehyde 2,1-aminomutase [Gemmatimonadales bacterium]|nr:glutamate-1-semialdehyde 2,1-aminomutase [Gemmatimonadales bacterium]